MRNPDCLKPILWHLEQKPWPVQARMGANARNLKGNPKDLDVILLWHHLMLHQGSGRERGFMRTERRSLSWKEVLKELTVT